MDLNYANYLLEKTRQDYNLIAEEFSRTRQEILEEMKFLFEDYLMPGERVLDLGCGNGRWVKLFQQKKVDYIGIDSSEKLIEIAKTSYPQAKFQVAEALNLPFPNNFFDKIYSIAVLHHIPSENLRIQFLKEAKRVLRPEGILILTVWRFHQKKEIFLLFKYTILKLIGKSKLDFKDIFQPWGKKIKRYYHWFSGKELRDLAKEAEFEIKEVGLVKNKKGNRQNIYLIAKKSP
ncbi:MAG: class I SAM-dependent methyltransferase [Candidatus Paceibacterales bacterium]